ncbi:MAG: hypothetical protein ACE10H_15265 [Candidatus Binatia bacterium]
MGSWKEDEKDRSIGTLAINLIELKEALLSRIEAMETALWEAKSTASHDAQQVEELKVLQGSLTAKIQELEYQKEGLSGLLDKHNVEFMTLKSDTETRVGKLEAHLQEMEESLRTKESAISQLHEKFTAKVQELEYQKENLSGLLDQHNAEIRSQAEAKVGMLEAQLRETEESLTAEIRELEDQLTEKESLLEDRQEELNDLRSKSGALGDASDGVLTLKEEDVVTINLLGHKGEKVITPSMGEEKMAKDRKDTAAEAERLRAQIQERDTMLAAKETEVKMINRTMEEELSRQLLEKEESLRTRESAAKRQEDILTARIHDLENRLREKEALLEEGEGKDFQQSLSNELESLKAELRDRNLLLQARETEVRMIKQSLNEKFRGLERIAQSSAGKDLKKSRLGSFLETIEKKN